MAKVKNNYWVFLILLLLTLPAIWSLLRPGFFLSDDGGWMIIRFSAFHQALVDGQFPVRWLGRLNHEYGYPVANFLYPEFMYLAEVPKILGFGFVSSIKIILGLSMVGSAIFTYLWLFKFFGKWGSGVGALFYLYAPYHLYDLYKRGSVGEILALALVPFILWQNERKNFFWITVGIASLIVSHNTLALLFIPVIIIYALISKYLNILISFFFALALSAFFWLPAIFDLKYTRFSKVTVSDFSQYFTNWESLGWATIFIFLLAFVLFAVRKIKISKYPPTAMFFTIGLLAIFFSSSASTLFWTFLPISFIQFPFRFLSVMILSGAFLAALAVSVINGKLKAVIVTAITVTIFVSSWPFLTPSQYFDKGDSFYATNEGTTTVQGEYMPYWVKNSPTERPRQKVEIINGEGEIKNQFFNSSRVNFAIDSKTDSVVQLNIIYFPGWKARVDGREVPLNYDNEKGVIQLAVVKGKHEVLAKFGQTPLALFSDIISLISFLLLAILAIKNRFFKRL